MKFAAKSLLLLIALATAFAYAQNNISQIQHIIVVVQENRTPDNLFGSDAFAQTRLLPGADLAQLGKCGNVEIQLQSLYLKDASDPNHAHQGAWTPTYDLGKMDRACTITTSGCTLNNPEYAYVTEPNVSPYFQIARQYGYANYRGC